jgi:hypothetical protein
MLLAGAVLAVALVVVLTSTQSASDQVKDKVQELASALSQQDYGRICDDVLAPSLVAHLTVHGIPCDQALRDGLGRVHNPVVSVGKVTVTRRRATAYTLTVASCQRASLDAVTLVDTKRGWRISSLTHL